MRRIAAWIVCAVFLGPFSAQSIAVTQFKKPFMARYVDGKDKPEFQRAVRKANCTLCHLKGEKKEVCNDYGLALSDWITGNPEQRLKDAKKDGRYSEELAKLLAELETAFDKVEPLAGPHGEAYGDRLRAGKLPAQD